MTFTQEVSAFAGFVLYVLLQSFSVQLHSHHKTEGQKANLSISYLASCQNDTKAMQFTYGDRIPVTAFNITCFLICLLEESCLRSRVRLLCGSGNFSQILLLIQSVNLFSQLCNNKNECQQNNVKHSDGLPEKQIAHLSWSPI